MQKSELCVPAGLRVHVPSCAHAWMCSSGGSGASWSCEWGWCPPTPRGLSQPRAGSGVPEGCSSLRCAAIL